MAHCEWPPRENLAAAAHLVLAGLTQKLRASSILTLCRSALESSARTVWLLSDPDRSVRRGRFLNLEAENLAAGDFPAPNLWARQLEHHRPAQARLLADLTASHTGSAELHHHDPTGWTLGRHSSAGARHR
jgi:hypothetical protein